MSVEEVEELQSALDQNSNIINEEDKGADGQTLQEGQDQRNEMQLMQQQLDEEKELMRAELLSKLQSEEVKFTFLLH